jgi:hypothetical protein
MGKPWIRASVHPLDSEVHQSWRSRLQMYPSSSDIIVVVLGLHDTYLVSLCSERAGETGEAIV